MTRLEACAVCRHEVDEVGLQEFQLITHIGVTSAPDPGSADRAIREAWAAFLRSRIDITAASGPAVTSRRKTWTCNPSVQSTT